jgi:hypothetical protein
MPLTGFEPTIAVFKRAKTFHALDRAATVAGCITEGIAGYQGHLEGCEAALNAK